MITDFDVAIQALNCTRMYEQEKYQFTNEALQATRRGLYVGDDWYQIVLLAALVPNHVGKTIVAEGPHREWNLTWIAQEYQGNIIVLRIAPVKTKAFLVTNEGVFKLSDCQQWTVV